MKKIKLYLFILSFISATSVGFAQNIPVNTLPTSVKKVLDQYITILKSETLEECCEKFVEIAGGSLVNSEFPITLYSDLKQFSLKKDFENIKFYANPIIITRVLKSESNGNGYGETAIAGTIYKIWIKKKEGVNGMPAPVQILVPKNHQQITTPKVVVIGSF